MASTGGTTRYRQLLWRDSSFVFLFMIYGLAAGIVTLVGSLSIDGTGLVANLSFPTNFPTFIVLFGVEWFLANPNGFHVLNGEFGTTTLMIGSIAVWSGIGLVVYGFVKMFRLGH